MWLLIVLCLLLYGLFRHKRRRLYQLADKIPSYGFSHWNDLYNFSGNNTDLMNTLTLYCKKCMSTKHGLIKWWLGPILYVASVNPVDVEVILKTCLEKDDLHRFIRKLIGNGVVFAPVPIWRRRRKIIVPAFAPRIIEDFFEVFNQQSQILAHQLEMKVNTGYFDVWRHISSYTLDSVLETIMGTKTRSQTTGQSLILESIEYLLNIINLRVFHVWLHPDWIFNLTSHARKHDECINIAQSYINEVIQKKRQQFSSDKLPESDLDFDLGAYTRKSFLDLLIELSGTENGYTNEELREEVLTLMVAGNDTSAVGTSFTILLLGKYQKVQEKVYQELLDVFGTSDRALVKEDLPKLKYLEWVIKESLRLYPPAPFIVRKIEEEIKLPSGVILPIGAGVCVPIWSLHRNPEYWGPNAEDFDPERFSPERYNIAHPCAYMPFSQGPRNCLGYQYAMMSAKTAISTILRRFKITISDEEKKKPKIDVKLNLMLKPEHGYNIALEKRSLRKIK